MHVPDHQFPEKGNNPQLSLKLVHLFHPAPYQKNTCVKIHAGIHE
jgi:hypothetical protein